MSGPWEGGRTRTVRLARAFAALVVLTFALIVLGALVRAHDAGLACPDWPLCFGTWLPPMNLRVAFEWSHRALAGSVAIGFLVLALATLRLPGASRPLRVLLLVGALLLIGQILLGGLTVLLRLASWTVTAHLLTGNAFAATLLLTRRQLLETLDPPEPALVPGALRAGVFAAAALLGLQLLLGGLVSSTYAGMACREWPACNAGVWFPAWHGAIGLHLAHRLNGYLLLTAVGAAALCARRHAALARPLQGGFLLAALQVGVGIGNVLLGIPAELTGLHSALATALVLTFAHALWTAGGVAPRSP